MAYLDNSDPNKWLEAIRAGTDAFEFCEKKLFETLANKGQSLDSIGSSHEEIAELKRQNSRKVSLRYAKFWLDRLRGVGAGNDQVRSLLIKELKKFSFSPEELQASPAEMDRLHLI